MDDKLEQDAFKASFAAATKEFLALDDVGKQLFLGQPQAKKSVHPLLDALTLVSKCRRSNGGSVCDPCWSAVTKELDVLGLHIWG